MTVDLNSYARAPLRSRGQILADSVGSPATIEEPASTTACIPAVIAMTHFSSVVDKSGDGKCRGSARNDRYELRCRAVADSDRRGDRGGDAEMHTNRRPQARSGETRAKGRGVQPPGTGGSSVTCPSVVYCGPARRPSGRSNSVSIRPSVVTSSSMCQATTRPTMNSPAPPRAALTAPSPPTSDCSRV